MKSLNKMISIGLSLLIVILLIGCSKKAESEKPLYIGNLEESINMVVNNKGSEVVSGEYIVSSYKIMDIIKEEGHLYVYLITSYYGFNKKDESLIKVSGLSIIPTSIIFQINDEGKTTEFYTLKSYKEKDSNVSNDVAIQLMFPSNLWHRGFAWNRLKEELEADIKEKVEKIEPKCKEVIIK